MRVSIKVEGASFIPTIPTLVSKINQSNNQFVIDLIEIKLFHIQAIFCNAYYLSGMLKITR